MPPKSAQSNKECAGERDTGFPYVQWWVSSAGQGLQEQSPLQNCAHQE